MLIFTHGAQYAYYTDGLYRGAVGHKLKNTEIKEWLDMPRKDLLWYRTQGYLLGTGLHKKFKTKALLTEVPLEDLAAEYLWPDMFE